MHLSSGLRGRRETNTFGGGGGWFFVRERSIISQSANFRDLLSNIMKFHISFLAHGGTLIFHPTFSDATHTSTRESKRESLH